ncbi:heparinase II/III family protein [Aliidiomarina haloalkalitolerans]|uniref:Heparinase n=1 Tax=Aliidiomarina haloalkalitolerans TaxID=859059 RepID=A0A432VQY2_9GAMM|nr:heparinase II/III family protein [Aliidiomarina haloalkalitolerans]RUO18672.1 heparinase [Aliidiomarina haloalkalitolerans]
MLKGLLLLLRTVRYLRLKQVTFQIWYRLRPIPRIAGTAKAEIKTFNEWHGHLYSSQSFFSESRFNFLNFSFEIRSTDDWHSPILEKLWRYNLHYFDDLNSTNSDQRVLEHERLIHKWINENPIMHGDGWEAYPLSLRIVNWIKWCSRNPEYVDQTILNSLHTQVRALEKQLEFHILANHLFANAKALAFAGQFFAGLEAKRWRKLSNRLLTAELKEQFLNDGAHYERSPMYHCILMWDLLDLYCLFSSRDPEARPVIEKIKVKVENGLSWLSNIIHTDGEIPFFNDSTFGIAPKVHQIQEYAEALGIRPSLLQLDQSNFIKQKVGPFTLVADVGEIAPKYQPGHAHAEAGSFELSIGTQRILVNSGIDEYGMSRRRLKQRSTCSHNTVEIIRDGQVLNSSEVWSGFRVARRASVSKQITEHSFECRIEGFWLNNITSTHVRKFDFGAQNKKSLVIHDVISSGVFGCAHFHFHPACQLSVLDTHSLAAEVGGSLVHINFSEHAETLRIECGEWYPEFGKAIPNKKISVLFKDKLVTTISS